LLAVKNNYKVSIM